MAKDNSFDIVSETDLQEVENAYNNAVKALRQRYDLKDSGSEIAYDKSAKTLTILAPSDFVAGQVKDILSTQLVRRKVDLKSVQWGKPQDASGGKIRIVGTIVEGIDQDIAKRISKDIRDKKLKVKVAIEGDKLRVSGPKRDTLQEVIAFVRDQDYGLPLQFTNYR
ncbi:MAG: YajQ family cyclic di-GMP-binding protein [Coriobacteriales bacterium]|jgi:uncharacterized protein YajQ (UPF0234 family)